MVTTIEEALACHAAETGERIALVIGRESYSYSRLFHGVKCACAVLRQQQIDSTMLLPFTKDFRSICFYFGAHIAGVRVLPADPHMTQESAHALCARVPVYACLSERISLPGVVHVDTERWEEAESLSCDFPSADSIADLMFTTGTTGTAKCVPLSHANLIAAARQINSYIGAVPGEKEVLALPLCHSFGLGRLRCLMLSGGTAIILPNFGNERKVLRSLKERGVAGFSMVPAAWQYLRHLCGERFIEAAANLRYIEFGSAALPIREKCWLAEHLPQTRICMHYGLTEASRSCFMEFHEDANRLDSVGRAAPRTEIGIFSENGTRLSVGQVGEICVKGAHVTRGYLNVARDTCFIGDFFRTGDVGYVDAEGYVYLSGRLKEIINVGGKKVSPTEVEGWIEQFPGVKECACIGVADPEEILGDVVKACIVWEGSPDEPGLRSFLRSHLEHYKQPRLYQVMDTPLPRTESGKLQRGRLV